MDTPSPSTRALARRLLAASRTAADAHEQSKPQHAAVRVCDALQVSLTKFAGIEGFVSLLRRALALARAEVPALDNVRLRADGRLEGFEEAVPPGAADEAVAIPAHLLGLLVTFIGEPLMLKLVREAWPDETWPDEAGPDEAQRSVSV